MEKINLLYLLYYLLLLDMMSNFVLKALEDENSMLMESRVKFISLQNLSGVSQQNSYYSPKQLK